MAGKRLGMLRQWAGEVISSKDKTVTTDEFRELESDIESRRKGLAKLQLASEAYHHVLSKKKTYDALPGDHDKVTARDALGIVMVAHGEEFGEDSAFGTSLARFGQGMTKVATLQQDHASNFKATFLASLRTYLDEIQEYHDQKKKLETKRLSYDASISKFERLKNSKKEKDRLDAQEELEATKSKYEEMSESVQIRMHAIQDNEIDQLKELGAFLDIELRFAERYLEVMRSVKADWVDVSNLESVQKPRPKNHSHTFSADTKSIRPQKSFKTHTIELSDDERAARALRTNSMTRRKSESEKPRSRSVSRASRSRTNSTATTGDKEKSLKMSVTGWASSAVSSMAGRGKKDTENFVGLADGTQDMGNDGNGEEGSSRFNSRRSSSRANSKRNTPNGSPSMPARILRSSLPSTTSLSQGTKIVRAMYDFSGSSEELSFKAGDEILLINEVADGWWMGELDGKHGSFPITYTEPVVTPPPVKSTSSAMPQRLVNWTRSFTGASSDEDDMSKATLMRRHDNLTATSPTSDDDEHPFGDHNHLVSYERSPVYGYSGASIDDADDKGLLLSDDEHGSDYIPSHRARKSLGKKAPPPPPPRRLPTSLNSTPPSLPDRRPRNTRSNSTSAIVKQSRDTMHVGTYFTDHSSPFDSPTRSQFASEIKRDPFGSRN